MSLEKFLEDPWSKSSPHPRYAAGILHMRPAPEYASGEVVLASTYRAVGFDRDPVSEGGVPARGREFHSAVEKGRPPTSTPSPSGMDAQAWRNVVESTLRSPKLPSQSNRRFLQLSPLVPDACLYSLSARLSANSWNPGQLVSTIIQIGEPSRADEAALWSDLFHALTVGPRDDVWARFLQGEFEAWRPADLLDAWRPCDAKPRETWLDAWHRSRCGSPAMALVRDLKIILGLKEQLTRRQWISILESLLRLGTAAHVLWVCAVNILTRDLLRKVIVGEPPPGLARVTAAFEAAGTYWRYGQVASSAIQNYATGFAKSRVFINLLLWHLEKSFGQGPSIPVLASPAEVNALCDFVASHRNRLDREVFARSYQQVIESYPREASGKKGIASNVTEFLQHVLRQRATNEKGLENYDQGYYLAKSGARWKVSMGPVSVLALAHACTATRSGPSTVGDLCHHIGHYGIQVEAQNVPTSSLGLTLRNLGIVLDSPDAEGGMVVVDPFATGDKD